MPFFWHQSESCYSICQRPRLSGVPEKPRTFPGTQRVWNWSGVHTLNGWEIQSSFSSVPAAPCLLTNVSLALTASERHAVKVNEPVLIISSWSSFKSQDLGIKADFLGRNVRLRFAVFRYHQVNLSPGPTPVIPKALPAYEEASSVARGLSSTNQPVATCPSAQGLPQPTHSYMCCWPRSQCGCFWPLDAWTFTDFQS